jgi:hypothetical protein
MTSLSSNCGATSLHVKISHSTLQLFRYKARAVVRDSTLSQIRELKKFYGFDLGASASLGIFAIAAVLHILHGQIEIRPLVVCSVAVLVCLSASVAHPSEALP